MPSTVKVRVKAARNLPLPDRSTRSSNQNPSSPTLDLLHTPLNSRDPYVVVSLGGASSIASSDTTGCFEARTSVCRRTVQPLWNEEFRFECSDDTLLQDEPLIFKVFDCDYTAQSANDHDIGMVYVDLNPLLTRQSYDDNQEGFTSIDGWFPLYDTLAGVCGELLLSVKLNYIGDVNPFRDSSAGVRLLPFSTIDRESGLVLRHVYGFVEELVVADDPEFDWHETIRKSKVSHEARQTLMYRLDCCVRRRMCKTVLDMGGNAVLGYKQTFDVEGDSGIVARSYGTCVCLERTDAVIDERLQKSLVEPSALVPEMGLTSTRSARFESVRHRETHGDTDDVQLLTLRAFEHPVRVRYGGLVTARSVKYLGNLASKLSDQETRDSWWTELRDEIRAHAKILCCTHVIGYQEASTIHDDVAILSITGTAATVRGLPDLSVPSRYLSPWKSKPKLVDTETEVSEHVSDTLEIDGMKPPPRRREKDHHDKAKHVVPRPRRGRPCSSIHVPYSHRLAPFSNLKLVPCLLCGKKWVPEVILTTVEPPENLPTRGSGVFVQARVCRSRPKATGEKDALAVSEVLPFLEYELFRQLMLKLKVLGRNAAFSLKTEVDVGRQLIVSTATATAVYCTGIPAPRVLEINRTIAVQDDEDQRLLKLQRQIEQISSKNRTRLAEAARRHADRLKRRKLKKEKRLSSLRKTESQRRKELHHRRQKRTHSGEGENSQKTDDPATLTSQTLPLEENEDTLSSVDSDSTSSSSSSSSSGSSDSIGSASDTDELANKKVDAVVDEGFADIESPPSPRRRHKSMPMSQPSDSDGGSFADIGEDTSMCRSDAKSIGSALSDELDDEMDGDAVSGLNGRSGRRRRRRRMYRDDKIPFVLEVDDETDEDLLSVLLDKMLPDGIRLCTAEKMPAFEYTIRPSQKSEEVNGQTVMAMLRFKWNPTTRGTRSNLLFSSLFQELFIKLGKRIKDFAPAVICGLTTQVNLTPDDQIELVCFGKVILGRPFDSTPRIPENHLGNNTDSDDTRADEIEIQRREDAEMAAIQEDIEASISAMFHAEPSIGPNRSTVIVDKLSEAMQRLHRAKREDRSSSELPAKPAKSNERVVSTGAVPAPAPDSSFRLSSSPTNSSPRATSLLGSSLDRILSPNVSPKAPSHLGRGGRIDDTKSLYFPQTPMNTPSSSGEVNRVIHFLPQPNIPLPSPIASGSWMKVEEVPVELSPLHRITGKKRDPVLCNTLSL